MGNLIYSIECKWDLDGAINARITGGSFSDELSAATVGFGPVSLILLAHQLATYTPKHGLLLTKKIIQSVLEKKILITPINEVLKKAKIDIVLTERETIGIQFYPQKAFLANDQKVELACRQFVNNYIMFVISIQPFYTATWLKIYLGLVIKTYLELLSQQISSGKLSPSNLEWNREISFCMMDASKKVSESYKIYTTESYDPKSVENNVIQFKELQELYTGIAKALSDKTE